jgi:plasmid stabilization system protein ParE
VRIVWTRLADRQACGVFETIAADNPVAAQGWLDRVLAQTRSLAAFPERGRLVPELRRADLRELLVRPYRVVYRRDDAAIVILLIHHDRRSLGPSDLGG